jgi:hypothetical protein
VTVTEGKTVTQKLEMSPKACYVRFLCRYKHAEVEVYDPNGKIGECGKWLKFAPFVRHQLMFRGRNFYEYTTELTLDKPGKDMNIEVPIKPSGLSWDRLGPDEWSKMLKEVRPEEAAEGTSKATGKDRDGSSFFKRTKKPAERKPDKDKAP